MRARQQWKFYVTLLLLLLAVLSVQHRQHADAQDPAPIVEEFEEQPIVEAPLAVVQSGFTYQGFLQIEGDPAEGVFDLRFTLYDASSDGAELDSVTESDVSVNEGRFTVPLAFDPAAFTGSELWLEVAVRPGSSASEFTNLEPRQLVQPAPYANTLRPGAMIAAAYDSTLLTLDNDSNNGLAVEAAGDGILVTAGEPDFYGIALGAGSGIEVNAENVGVYVGRANEYGVWVNSAGNHGVYAQAVYDGSDSNASGVFGVRSGTVAGYGGHFVHNDSGTAVLGEGLGSGDSEGLVGLVNSANGEALEAINTGDSLSANIILACSSSACGDIEFRVQRDGDVTADGAFTGGGADYADLLEVAGHESQYEPGDLLVVDNDGLVTTATEAYDPAVVGVYSTQPAFVGDPRGTGQRLGDAGQLLPEDSAEGIHTQEQAGSDGLVPVALVGVVPVKASAENGPITPGDLLAASSTPGHVMKAEPTMVDGVPIYPTGAVVGKAMEPLENGTDMIKMLVMPQ